MIARPELNKDFYKADHGRQYPAGTTMVYSNMTARSNNLAKFWSPNHEDKIVFFGLQYFLKYYLGRVWQGEFFDRPKYEIIRRYKRRMDNALGEDAFPLTHIADLHDLGYLPIMIKALPEGARVPIGVPCVTIKNTDPKFYWLTNFLETVMSSYLWKPITSATTAYEYRRLLDWYAKETAAPADFVPFQGHDFSFRGMVMPQEAALSGAAHLLSFVGTDTIPAIDFLEDYYKANSDKELIGCSVPATEHSVMCMGGQETEYDTFNRLLSELYPKGIVSIVSDTWDFWKVVTETIPALKDKIMAREGKVVIRPDSGDPVKILVGEPYNTYDDLWNAMTGEEQIMGDEARDACEGSYCMGSDVYTSICKVADKFFKITAKFEYNRHDKQYYYVDNSNPFEKRVTAEEYFPTPEFKGLIECLYGTFGGTRNKKGYIELDPHIGAIYGDSITIDRAEQIMEGLMKKGFASTNVVLGIGSYTYQFVTRDTHGFAIKATAGTINGELIEISKNPKTDNGSKKSAKGLLRIEKNEQGEYVLHQQQTEEEEKRGELTIVYQDGFVRKTHSLSEIRGRLHP